MLGTGCRISETVGLCWGDIDFESGFITIQHNLVYHDHEAVSYTHLDKAVEVVTDVVRTETRKEDMRMIEDTKKWVLSPERKAPQATRAVSYTHLDVYKRQQV